MRPTHVAAGLAAILALLAPVAGCASVPSSGPVMSRQADQSDEDAVGFIPPEPADDADPARLVRSFLLAGGSGSTATTQYEQYDTARLYLTNDVQESWAPTENVVVYSGAPDITVDAEGADAADVTVSVDAVSRVDAHGMYAEASTVAPFTTSFSLTRDDDEQWRIDELEDGILVPERQFANQFKATRLYFPTQDLREWVPDQRWFPRSAWRTSAVAEVLTGPPAWLQDAVDTVAPVGTQLAVPTVTDNSDGAVEVRLGGDIADLDETKRGLLFGQLEVTLSDGEVRPEIALYAGDARLSDPMTDKPDIPSTRGTAIALSGEELYTVSDDRLADFERSVHLEELDPTAIALGPGASPVVVRDGRTRILRVADVDNATGQQELLAGTRLVEPSVDRHGYVWSSDDPGHDDFDPSKDDGELLVAHESGTRHDRSPEWLSGRQVIGVRVAPDGARVAVVSRRAGTTSVHVAAVRRGENGEPEQLTTPLEVAASVPGVVSAQWSGETSLLLLTRDDEGTTAMYETGVGGLPDDSGSTETVQELADVTNLAAGVTDAGALALTRGGDLYQENATGWGDPIAEDIAAVAYPG
ncbi:LpqB family beta-propeller domain-containing protein [Myceligenerans xiligouense]|uniref:Lipoprotein LpqB-like beta-propeller protein n=1 Tax=Myceligenerans xiligouense TaxID=253184 RepID=A0A3N4Z2A2_9MICO|nr:LpqB family beta-propeller domain-containing protein [Myceligenerans xiligouense]RPF20148.1 lipoprotein LpqB-like beta-propeller protein [Myceligenerans xiligouense]